MKKAFTDDDLVKNLSLYYLNRHLKKKPIEKYHRQIDDSSLHEREKYKKKNEILLLNSFLHHFPKVKFENLICESPDFIATIDDKKIGIELTEVINHLEMKKIENQMNKVFRMAEMILEKDVAENYKGVYFITLKPITMLDLLERENDILTDICKAVRRNKTGGFVDSIRKSPHRRNVFITYDYNLNLFDGLCAEKIVELIRKKNQKYPFYDSSVDECWLVIVSDMNSLASRYSFIQNKESLKKINSPFHKIFHLENLCGNLTNIK
ncbi:MAG: hypothetical protein Q4G16_08985 [Cruoricaptor ignavus]|nr:hypothetical protein [Cruoricaptor ignavus]